MVTPNTTAAGGFLTPTSPPPAYDDSLADQIVATVVGITGLDGTLVRPRWQPRPPQQPDRSVNWCAVGVTSISADTNATLIHNPAGDGTSTEYRGEEISVLASFYGPNCTGYASRLRDCLGVGPNLYAMIRLGLAFVASDRMTAVPDLTNLEWVNRVDLAFRLRRRVARTYGINNILIAEGAVTSDISGAGSPMTTSFSTEE